MENKYQTVKDGIKNAILSGQYKIDDQLPTESELMVQYKVSRFTIRRAVGDLEAENFITRVQGRGMFVGDWHKGNNNPSNNKMIGIITTHIANYIFPEIISGIDHTISESGYSLLLSNTHNTFEKERQSLLNMLDSRVAGLIVEPTKSAVGNPNLDLYQEIIEDQIPIVFINAPFSTSDIPVVKEDDKAAEKRLIQYLFSQGHENILGIFQVDDFQGQERMNGMIEAYQENPQLVSKSNVIMYQSNDDLSDVIKRSLLYLDSPQKPTAIACYNDQLAIELMSFLKDHGYQVPEDVSVVGFDDFRTGQYVTPSLTTMSHAKENLGAKAGELIMERINKHSVDSYTFKPDLVVRDSVKDLTK